MTAAETETLPHKLRWANRRVLVCVKVNSDGQVIPVRRRTTTTTTTTTSFCVDFTQQPPTTRHGETGTGKDSPTITKCVHESPEVDPNPPSASNGVRGYPNEDEGLNDLTADSLEGIAGLKKTREVPRDRVETRFRTGCGRGAAVSGEKTKRAKFSVALSRMEIEEDLFAMAGRRPACRTKKRAKIVQKDLDALFPGVWLKEVTPDMYKVGGAHRV